MTGRRKAWHQRDGIHIFAEMMNEYITLNHARAIRLPSKLKHTLEQRHWYEWQETSGHQHHAFDEGNTRCIITRPLMDRQFTKRRQIPRFRTEVIDSPFLHWMLVFALWLSAGLRGSIGTLERFSV